MDKWVGAGTGLCAAAWAASDPTPAAVPPSLPLKQPILLSPTRSVVYEDKDAVSGEGPFIVGAS